MKRQFVNIGDKVYVINKYGDWTRDGFDIQINQYEVGYKGEDSFVPKEFQHLSERYQVIKYADCYQTPQEAMEVIREAYGKRYEIEFTEHYNGMFYDVVFKDKKNK